MFTKTKIAWHLESISNYTENLPKMSSYPPQLPIYKRFANVYIRKLQEGKVLPPWLLKLICCGDFGLGIILIIMSDMFDGCQSIGSIMIVQSLGILLLCLKFKEDARATSYAS